MSNTNVGWFRILVAVILFVGAVLTPVGSYESWGFFIAYLFVAYKGLSTLWAESDLPPFSSLFLKQ